MGSDINITNVAAVVAVVVLLAMAYQGGVFQGLGFAPTEDGAPQPVTVKVEGACGVDSTTLTANVEKRYAQATSMSGENVTIVKDGALYATVSDGSSTTVSPGNMLELYNGFDSSTYYTSYAKGEVPCDGAVSTSDKFFMPNDAYKLYQMDAATSTVFSIVNDDGTSTNPGTAQAVGIGDTNTFKVTLSPTYEDGLGIPCGNVLSCQYNTSAYADAKEDALRLNIWGGAPVPSATDPSNTLWTALSTDHTKKSWALPAIDGKVISKLEYALTTLSDETNNPTGGGGDVNCTIWDGDYFKTDDGAHECGIEDTDDNSDVGLTSDATAFKFGILIS